MALLYDGAHIVVQHFLRDTLEDRSVALAQLVLTPNRLEAPLVAAMSEVKIRLG
uniref:Uncharacterized protein n=1 Tax=uncultured bacterium ws020C1 TaxID=1131823 RepID=I1X4L0_9BACT|nr:hypothetical protein ws020C1_0030 [uncultured bacterium ws020C1]